MIERHRQHVVSLTGCAAARRIDRDLCALPRRTPAAAQADVATRAKNSRVCQSLRSIARRPAEAVSPDGSSLAGGELIGKGSPPFRIKRGARSSRGFCRRPVLGRCAAIARLLAILVRPRPSRRSPSRPLAVATGLPNLLLGARPGRRPVAPSACARRPTLPLAATWRSPPWRRGPGLAFRPGSRPCVQLGWRPAPPRPPPDAVAWPTLERPGRRARIAFGASAGSAAAGSLPGSAMLAV